MNPDNNREQACRQRLGINLKLENKLTIIVYIDEFN